MRIVLAGPQADRDRLRRELLDAGFDIVAETDARPSPADGVPAADAIVEATSGGHASVLRNRALSGDVVTEALTAREQVVLAHVAQGMSNKAIAEALGISDQTVKFHVAAIIGKLGASNRTDAVRRAIRRGLVVI
jgi:DNA-binding NarL/FixJ family response regulator